MKNLILIAAILVLAGCAEGGSVLQNISSTLQALNGGGTIQKLGDEGGYQPVNLSVPSEPGICDRTAYMDGFKTGYVNTWNKSVSSSATNFRLGVELHPKDTAAKHNYALYKNKQIIYSSGKESLYVAKWDDQGNITNSCQSSGFMSGKHNGNTAGSADLGALQAQEVSGGTGG